MSNNTRKYTVICHDYVEYQGLDKLDMEIWAVLKSFEFYGLCSPILTTYRKGKKTYKRSFPRIVADTRDTTLFDIHEALMVEINVAVGDVVYVTDSNDPGNTRLAFVRVL